ncbi:lipopolysaccharide assembly outer membrane protein LptD (OstA) [Chryseobacterium sp. 16F]|uniref:Lipopolysaccharide assembly outer membrane protein LptD (OstA) n=1 Tax=Frigoriflavimonas asaccharolytica TaxID=2735899 RepID=A0A8J8K961_9FLAO|nr:lipopolysaccharide assembly outer membrane protein LptD (OstA) [Frigoriflavimonas asaccharolytica]
MPKVKDSNIVQRKSDTVIVKKEQLTSILYTKADETRSDVAKKKVTYLIGNAQVKYGDMQIDADYIQLDIAANTVFARGKQDSLGKIVGAASATQAGKTYEYTEFNYNLKTGQAIAFNARTEESEGVIVAQKTKKYNDSVFFMRRGKYTTDEYFLKKKDSLSDYYLLAPNIKLVKGKNKSSVITGPVQLYIEQVPTPLIMPFAILPFSDKRSAGILIPSFGEREDVGFFLNGIGYYQPLGEHFDLKILADYYTKGSYNIRPEVNYAKKYKYNGNLNLDIGNTVRGIKGLDDYSKTATYRISWRHSQDTKSNPLLTFAASVDVVSNKFYNNNINNNYIFNQNTLNAQQNSTLSVTKRFLRLPITITGTSSYSQNFSSGIGSIRLPQMNVAINQFYLFTPKTGIREGLLENINVNTGFNFTNSSNFEDGKIFQKEMFDNLQTGLTNSIQLATNTTVAKYFTVSLGGQINNALTTKTLSKEYNPVLNVIEDTMNKGIAGFSTFTTNASMNTTLYGTKIFKKGSAIQGIRHVITPSVGFSYSPDFSRENFGYYRNYNTIAGALTPYSIFDGGIVGSPSSGEIGALTFSLNNNIEMKVRSKTDSTGSKKVKLFETLSIDGSYNFAADTNPWSAFSIRGQTSVFEGKLNINTNLTLDPYETIFLAGETSGTRSNNFGAFSVQGFGLQLSYPLSEAIFGKQEDLSKKYKSKGEIRNEVYYFDENNYARFQQPWTLNINAQYSYTRNLTLFGTKVASVGLDGTMNLTPYWSINGSTFYDVVSKKLDYTRIGFTRDQRSFSINFNWVPFGQFKVYDFFIGIKANILSDTVKYEERSFQQPNAVF